MSQPNCIEISVMGVVCQILINKTKETFFRPGTRVTGIVKYNIDKPTECKAITLSFLGKGICRWIERRKNSSTTYTETEEFVYTKIDILETKVDIDILEGNYEYPFEFALPEYTPSSYRDIFCNICYRIELKFKRPKVFGFDNLFITEIPVKGYIIPTAEGPVIFGLDKTLTDIFAFNKPIINMAKAEVEKTYQKPGENINTSLYITNNTDLTTNVRISLYCFIVYIANCGRTTSSFEKIRECSLDITSIPPQGVANLTQSIPTTINLHSINSKVMRKEYKLRVSIKLPMPHRNEYVEMPVLIGERMIDEEKEEEMSSEIEDAPPAYWEVMGEEKVGDEEYEKDAED